jgi:signal transduction histidine kinase
MPVLGVVLGLGLLAQTVWWAQATGIGRGADIALALALGTLCLAWGWHMLRRALYPLVVESFRLQEMAIGWEAGRAISAPSHAGTDTTLEEIERLRRALYERLEDSQRLRKQAEEASDYKTGFLKSVQHELRTPLNSILGFTEVLLSGIEGPLTMGQRENLVVIQRTGKRLHELFDEVIELAAMAAGQLELRRDAVDVGALLEQLGEMLEEERGNKPVHIQVELADGLPPVTGDAVRLTRLLKGIANQALAVLGGPLLVLEALPAGDAVQLWVRDPARTLAREDVESLLGPQPTAVRRKGLDEGSRLRIAVWRQLAMLFGGRLELRSDDRGTAFMIELPAWTEP